MDSVRSYTSDSDFSDESIVQNESNFEEKEVIQQKSLSLPATLDFVPFLQNYSVNIMNRVMLFVCIPWLPLLKAIKVLRNASSKALALVPQEIREKYTWTETGLGLGLIKYHITLSHVMEGSQSQIIQFVDGLRQGMLQAPITSDVVVVDVEKEGAPLVALQKLIGRNKVGQVNSSKSIKLSFKPTLNVYLSAYLNKIFLAGEIKEPSSLGILSTIAEMVVNTAESVGVKASIKGLSNHHITLQVGTKHPNDPDSVESEIQRMRQALKTVNVGKLVDEVPIYVDHVSVSHMTIAKPVVYRIPIVASQHVREGRT